MTTHPVYDLLLQEVTDELERKVLSALIDHAGEKVTRPELVFAVYAVYVQQGALSSSLEDRKIREAIERLQRREYPILASSGAAGYVLACDDTELDSYIGEIVSRQNTLLEKERALRRSRRWINYIREYKANAPAKQISMFAKPTVMP